MSNSPSVTYPRKSARQVREDLTGALVPKPLDPAEVVEAHARMVAQQPTPPSYNQWTRQRIILLDGDIARLDAEIQKLSKDYNDLQAQKQHLEAFLALADPQEG